MARSGSAEGPETRACGGFIGSNLIIGSDGKIAYQTLLDTDNFDAKLVKLRAKLDKILGAK